jgi:YD repeat-containing protein
LRQAPLAVKRHEWRRWPTTTSRAGRIPPPGDPADPAAGTWSTDGTGAWATAVAAGTTPGYFSQTLSYYNAQGQVAETVSPSGLRTGTIYYPDGSVEYTGPLLASVSDAAADPWYQNLPDGPVPSEYFATWTQSLPNQVDAQGNLFSRTVDQLGHITDTYQDASGRTVETVYDDGSFTQTVYSVGDQPVTILPAPMGWMVATGGAAAITLSPPTGLTIPAGGSETVTVAQRKLGDTPVVTYDVYDAAGNLVDVYEPPVLDADPASPTYGQMVAPHWHYTYDTSGDELTQTDAKGRVTTWAYDENGNKVSETLPGGERQTWAYDAYGDVILHKEYGQTNGVTNTTASRTTYDVYDTSNDGHGGRLLAEYRFAGDVNPTGTSPAGWAEKTVYTYDDTPNASQGELGTGGVLEVDDYTSANPSTPSTFTRYAYDPVTGKQASVTTPEGTVNYRYDPATGELMETWTGTAGPSAAGTDVVYGYDDQGRLASVTQARLDGAAVAAGAATVRYDADGHSITTTQPTTVYAYDAAGNLQSASEPNGQTTTYTYDDLNRLTLETVTQGPTLVETFDYDQVLVTGTKNAGLMLQPDGDRGGEVDTRYAANGTTIVSQTTTAWTYDADDRLTGEAQTVQVGAGLPAVPAAFADAFHYDLANNRTEEDINGGDTTAGGQSIRYAYDADDQLRTETETAYATGTTTTQVYQTTYTYDYAGNLWTETRTGTSAASDTYTYDLRDRMTKAVESSTETDYGYDTAGVRVSEGSPGGTQTYYVNDPANPTGYAKAIEEKTGTSASTAATSRSYVLGLKVEAQSDATNGTLYLLTDGHGSTRALVNAAGQTVETYAYDAFGTLLAGTHTNPQTNVTTTVTAATAATAWLFGGDGLYDPASGWTYHLARWTDGFWFTTSDFGPSGSGSRSSPSSLSRYLYADSDPALEIDPSGHAGLIDSLIGISLGTLIGGLALYTVTGTIAGIKHILPHRDTDLVPNWGSGVGDYNYNENNVVLTFPPGSGSAESLSDEIYSDLVGFQDFNPGNISQVSFDNAGHAFFDTEGNFFGWASAFINPIAVAVGLVDSPENHEVTAVTEGAHMLNGIRKFDVKVLSTSPVTLEVVTHSWDRPSDPANAAAYYGLGRDNQLKIWSIYMQNIANHYIALDHASASAINVTVGGHSSVNPWRDSLPADLR